MYPSLTLVAWANTRPSLSGCSSSDSFRYACRRWVGGGHVSRVDKRGARVTSEEAGSDGSEAVTVGHKAV